MAFKNKQKLLRETPSPRMIFVGGSGLAYGLDSEMIGSHFERYNVINTGLAYKIGMRFMLENVKTHLKPGDLVVLIPEYQLFYEYFDGSITLFAIVEIEPDVVESISFSQVFSMLDEFPQYFQRHFNFLVNSTILNKSMALSYEKVSNFNRYGDFEGHLGLKSVDITKIPLFAPDQGKEFDKDSKDYLNRFYGDIREKGADAVLIFPLISGFHYRTHKEKIDLVYDFLKDGLNMPILNTPQEFTADSRLFFNQKYHMNIEGRKYYNPLIINKLKLYLSKLDTQPATDRTELFIEN
ncbi:MAG: hypothetical protein GF307_12695 [candidate division Zixibacteria bacterium]|nr:hypothetical protein [candidate division Zixibacteria bacterium]